MKLGDMKLSMVKTIIDGLEVDLDPYCVNAVLLLNAKGYITSDCCQGHLLGYEKDKRGRKIPQISFPYLGFIKEYMPPTWPSFIEQVLTYGEHDEKIGIYFKISNKPTESELELLWNKITHWVLDLPVNYG